MSTHTDDTSPRTSTEHDQTGLSVSIHDAASAAARVDVGERPQSGVWHAIATSDAFQETLVDAVRDLLAGVHHTDRIGTLLDAGVTAVDGGYARLVTGLERSAGADVHQRALDLTAQLGQDGMTVLGHARIDAVADGPLAVLEAADRHPTIAVRIKKETFSERDRDQREDTLSLLTTLGTVCDVRLVCTGRTARWLRHKHRSDLSAEFDERLTAGRDEGLPTDEAIDVALDALDADGRAVHMLRLLAEEPAKTLPQRELVAAQEVGKATVSTTLSDLEELNLAERFSRGRQNHVELTKLGSAYLDTLDAEIGRQAELDALFDGSGQSDQRPCKHPCTREEGEALTDAATADGTAAAPYRTRFLGRADHAAAAGTATAGGITAAEASVPDVDDAEDRHTRYVSYDPDRDEAVVAVRATTPLQYMVSMALSLASPRFFDQALPADRLDSVDDPPAIMRQARCIGGLSSEAADDPETLRENLVEWGANLASETTKHRRGEYDDRDRHRGQILRSAHGLAGTLVHLLDVAGVDLVREVRVPGSLGHENLAALSQTVTIAASIQSRYGHFATYRQLFEQRDGKRQSAFSPDVDAADPFGQYIGSLVIRGPDAHTLGQHIEGSLRTRRDDVHEDAPEIAVRLSVTTPDRTAYAEVASRMCSQKRLQTTREAVTMFRTLAGSPYAVAEAIHWLGTEDRPRDIRLDEVRVALSRLSPKLLLPNAPPSVSKVIAALLRTVRPLSQTALAEKADVSERSLRRHVDVLEALDLVRDTDEGYRLTLPFNTDEERGDHLVPAPVDDNLASAQELLFDIVLDYVDADEAGRLGDPDDPLGAPFFGPVLDEQPLRDELPWLGPWICVARNLCDDPDPLDVTVSFGADIEQTALADTSSGGGAA